MYRILVINPGSTSTKIAIYEDEKQTSITKFSHSFEQLSQYPLMSDEFHFRLKLIEDELKKDGTMPHFDAIIGRGGLSKPIEGGVYEVNEEMLDDARNSKHRHSCDLGCLIADAIAKQEEGCRSFIADPGVTDEMYPEAHISGSPDMPRICIWHALNQRAIARRFAREHQLRYEELNLIVCHLGGGISIAAHEHGRAVDANNALDGEGPFSPVRAGTLPVADVVRACFSGKWTQQEFIAFISGKAGLTAHLGTNDMKEILRRIAEGDKQAELVVDAMLYHTAKQIAAEGAVLCGKIDAIILTGGLVNEEYITLRLRHRLSWLAPIYCYPGEDEMGALAQNALMVLRGEVSAKEY